MIDIIRLTNFLTFQEVEVQLAPLTVLTGTNSAGKSSLLHALAVLKQSDDAQTLPASWMLNGDLVDIGTGRDLLHANPTADDSIKDLAIEIALRSAGEAFVKWRATYVSDADELEGAVTPPTGKLGELLGEGFQYLKADRIVPAVVYPKSHEAVRVRKWIGSRGEHAPNFLRVFAEEAVTNKAALHPEAASRGLLDQTNAWLGELSPGTSLSVEDVPGTDFVRLSFSRSGPDVRTDRHRATNVGFGMTYALPVIVACLSAAPGSLLLIENPEAHLHPAGQGMLARLCVAAAAGGAQVVLETHSDHVLNAVRIEVMKETLKPAEVLLHFFSRTAGVLQPGLITIEVGSDGSLQDWPSGFFDQWDRDLTTLLD